MKVKNPHVTVFVTPTGLQVDSTDGVVVEVIEELADGNRTPLQPDEHPNEFMGGFADIPLADDHQTHLDAANTCSLDSVLEDCDPIDPLVELETYLLHRAAVSTGNDEVQASYLDAAYRVRAVR